MTLSDKWNIENTTFPLKKFQYSVSACFRSNHALHDSSLSNADLLL